MLQDPEFEPEFYKSQIKQMETRYAIIFKRQKVKWGEYYKYIKEQLRFNRYWIWIYLCGLEKFIQENPSKKKFNALLEDDANERIARIIGDTFRVENYINDLNSE